MRTSTIMLAIAALLALAPAASAKEISKVEICGASACTTLDRGDYSSERLHLFTDAGAESEPPAKGAAWYRIRFTARGDGASESWTIAWVPSAHKIRGRGDAGQFVWSDVLSDTAPLLRRAIRGLQPLPAARLRGLDARPPEAQVAEVVPPPASDPAPAPASRSGTPWGWIAGGVTAALLIVALRARRGRMAPAAS